jgi:hypothetical protein
VSVAQLEKADEPLQQKVVQPANIVKIKKLAHAETQMNQSLSKLSERLRNNSSTSSVGGTNNKLKLKFKPIVASGVGSKAESQLSRRDRNTRIEQQLNQGPNAKSSTLK